MHIYDSPCHFEIIRKLTGGTTMSKESISIFNLRILKLNNKSSIVFIERIKPDSYIKFRKIKLQSVFASSWVSKSYPIHRANMENCSLTFWNSGALSFSSRIITVTGTEMILAFSPASVFGSSSMPTITLRVLLVCKLERAIIMITFWWQAYFESCRTSENFAWYHMLCTANKKNVSHFITIFDIL